MTRIIKNVNLKIDINLDKIKRNKNVKKLLEEELNNNYIGKDSQHGKIIKIIPYIDNNKYIECDVIHNVDGIIISFSFISEITYERINPYTISFNSEMIKSDTNIYTSENKTVIDSKFFKYANIIKSIRDEITGGDIINKTTSNNNKLSLYYLICYPNLFNFYKSLNKIPEFINNPCYTIISKKAIRNNLTLEYDQIIDIKITSNTINKFICDPFALTIKNETAKDIYSKFEFGTFLNKYQIYAKDIYSKIGYLFRGIDKSNISLLGNFPKKIKNYFKPIKNIKNEIELDDIDENTTVVCDFSNLDQNEDIYKICKNLIFEYEPKNDINKCGELINLLANLTCYYDTIIITYSNYIYNKKDTYNPIFILVDNKLAKSIKMKNDTVFGIEKLLTKLNRDHLNWKMKYKYELESLDAIIPDIDIDDLIELYKTDNNHEFYITPEEYINQKYYVYLYYNLQKKIRNFYIDV